MQTPSHTKEQSVFGISVFHHKACWYLTWVLKKNQARSGTEAKLSYADYILVTPQKIPKNQKLNLHSLVKNNTDGARRKCPWGAK